MHAWCLQNPEEGIGCPETWTTDDCEPPYRGWELNLSPLSARATNALNCGAISPSPSFLYSEGGSLDKTQSSKQNLPGIYIGSGHLNSGPLAFKASTLLTEPPLSPIPFRYEIASGLSTPCKLLKIRFLCIYLWCLHAWLGFLNTFEHSHGYLHLGGNVRVEILPCVTSHHMLWYYSYPQKRQKVVIQICVLSVNYSHPWICLWT